MKCHGKSHKNPEGAETDARGRKGNQKALGMLGRAGKDTVTPETTNNKGTGAIRASSGGLQKREICLSPQTKFSAAFQERGFPCKMDEGEGCPRASKRSTSVSPLSPIGWVPRARVPFCPHGPGVLKGAGPWEGQ